MTTLTCHDAEELLDLHAAAECAPSLVPSLEQHLASCPTCARKFDEAVKLMGGLDWHHGAEAGLERLLDEIEAQPLPFRARKPRRTFFGRFVAAAALVLVSLGLTRGPDGKQGESTPVTLIATGQDRQQLSRAPAVPAHEAAAPKVVRMELELKEERLMTDAARKGAPQPLELDAKLEVRNPNDRVLFFNLASPDTRLTLDLRGPGVLKLPLPGPAKPLGRDFYLQPRDQARVLGGLGRVFPGPLQALFRTQWDRAQVRLRFMVGGTMEYPYALYWTKPGTYTLTARLRVPVCDGDRTTLREFVLDPVTIEVLDPRE